MKSMFKLIAVSVFLASCVANGTQISLSGNTRNATENGKQEFIELNDGTIIEGEIEGDRASSFSVFGGKGAINVNGKKYDYSSIKAVQQNNKYFQKYGKRLVERIVSGKINVFREKREGGAGVTSGSTVTTFHFYLQKGKNEKLKDFDLKLLGDMLADNSNAFKIFNDYKTLSNKEKRKVGDSYLDRAISTYNEQ
jgi:hypothetical protein